MEGFSIRFREMSDEEFDKFVEYSVLDYSKDLINSGRSSEEKAFERAKKEFNEILPQGKDTKNNFIYIIENNENEDVGIIWYGKYSESKAFIWDFLILDKFRRKGYGKQALLLVEEEAKKKGMNRIDLNVFKFNDPAFSLYKCLGYKIIEEDSGSMHMAKEF